MKYKLRCEYHKDANEIINKFHKKQLAYNIELKYQYREGSNNKLSVLHDCEIEFYSSLNKEKLIEEILKMKVIQIVGLNYMSLVKV